MKGMKQRATQIIFLFMTALFGWYLWDGYKNPPSANFHNPHNTYQSYGNSESTLMPPPRINPETKITQQTTQYEIEQWRAERSDLAAQWEMVDVTTLAFRAGLLGIVLLAWTLSETRMGASAAWEAVKVGKTDSMPNLHIKDFKHSAIIFDEAGNMRAYRLLDKVICSISFTIENRGRTSAKNAIVLIQARIRAKDTREVIEEMLIMGFEQKKVSEPSQSDTVTQSLFDLPASDEIPVGQGLLLPFGETIIFNDVNVTGFHIYRIEVDITLKYQTVFGDNVIINQSFGIRALQENGTVERITRIQEEDHKR